MILKPLKIGKYTMPYPIIQGGMGVGISWDRLAGAVSKEGGLGVISCVGTGYYQNQKYVRKSSFNRPFEVENFYCRDALFKIVENAKRTCSNAPIGANILYAINDYARVVKDACEAGIDIIITGAGLPLNMPELTKDFKDVALVPIISSAKALKLICKRWKQRYDRLPDAFILEGPLSGGHQGFKYQDCQKDEFKLENLIPKVVEEAKNWGDIPIIAAGGIWDKSDIERVISLGASGVQMGTRFIGTFECDADDKFKELLIESKREDIELLNSPVGYPARGVRTKLIDSILTKEAPEVRCISNCVAPCKRGQEAKAVGYCIADRLADSFFGKLDTGLFFSGSNGYRLNEIVSVKDLIKKLIKGE
jgi:nitronate monooxygenase